MISKILIADDEPHIRLLLGRILEEFEDEGGRNLEGQIGHADVEPGPVDLDDVTGQHRQTTVQGPKRQQALTLQL